MNTDQPYDRQRYTAAHEAGHLVLGHDAPERAFVSYLGRRFDPVEVHADQFAAELLVPTEVLRQEAKRLPPESLPEQIYRLATAFMVSYQAMTTRLVKLGAVSPAQAAEASKAKPMELARHLRLSAGSRRTHFQVSSLPEIMKRNLLKDWRDRASAETVRLLQEAAYRDYVERVPDQEQADDAAVIYQEVALWFAKEFPLVAA